MASPTNAKRDSTSRAQGENEERQRPGETYAQYRKRRHRETETVRRSRVNTALETLRELTGIADKTDQATVLEHAATALKSAQRRVAELEEQLSTSHASLPTPLLEQASPVIADDGLSPMEANGPEASTTTTATSLDEIQLSQVDFDLLAASLITDTLPSEIPMIDAPTECCHCNCFELKAKHLPPPPVCPCDELGPRPVAYLDSEYLPADVGIMLFNSAYHMVDCNEGFANLVRRDKTDIIGHSPVEFGIKSGNEVTQEAAMRLMAGQINTLVTVERMINSQGEEHWVRCSLMALARDPVSGQRCFFGIMQPISAHSKGCHVVSTT
eukprot:m.40796 g.40796  ORF g.40796 m.40796 type:complete len:327 (-) comp12780_c0_seq1:21-1001(-)